MTVKRIITHAGDAHRDDFMSVALHLAISGECPVLRRDPSEDELEDPSVLVLDVGGRCEPEKGNFDHHQRGREETPECALSLWAKHIVYRGANLRELLEMSLWFDTTVKMDVMGPFAVSKGMGLTPDSVFALGSPIERSLLGMFGEMEEVPIIFIKIMKMIGNEILDALYKTYEGVERIRNIRKMTVVDGVDVTVIEDENTDGLSTLRRTEGKTEGIGVMFDNRGDGWALLRFDDDPRVDFTKIKDDPDVLFAHPNGFIAKTHDRLALDEVLGLIKRSLA